MRHIRLLLYPCSVLLFALPAVASSITGQISIAGSAESANSVGMGSAIGINFASGSSRAVSGSSGDLYNYGAAAGSFVGLTCASSSGACGTIKDIANFATEGPVTSFLTFNTGGPSISFDLSSIESVTRTTDVDGGSLTVVAQGIIDFSGYDPTPGELVLIAQGNNIVSFSGTLLTEAPAPPTATPEPGSLFLLAAPMALMFAQRRRLLGKRA